jgi:MHS family proline/betaine transporter-like MFS transporter
VIAIGKRDTTIIEKPGTVSSRTLTSRHTVIAGAIGNVLEWYDFSVYAFFASTIGRQFFPQANEVDSLIAAFGVFAAGYLMRPLGGIIFGHIGDRYGRKPVLIFSALAMAIPTFTIGLRRLAWSPPFFW